jgi:DNA-binding LytR/AlgR family response regulator
LNDIFYFESIENKTFAYSVNEVYEISEKLYMLETQLEKTPFIRISKSIILNSKKIKSFKNTINGRMEATLKNNEKVKISRMYVTNLKEKLGGTKR